MSSGLSTGSTLVLVTYDGAPARGADRRLLQLVVSQGGARPQPTARLVQDGQQHDHGDDRPERGQSGQISNTTAIDR